MRLIVFDPLMNPGDRLGDLRPPVAWRFGSPLIRPESWVEDVRLALAGAASSIARAVDAEDLPRVQLSAAFRRRRHR